MKKRGKRKKIWFFARPARHSFNIELIIFIVIFAGLVAIISIYMVYEKKAAIVSNETSAAPEQASFSLSARTPALMLASSVESAATSTPVFFPLDLSYDMSIYVYSKKKYVCNDYRNVVKPNYFSMRCKVASGIWRGHLVKKIDVAGYSKLRVKAGLGVNDYTDYFAECGHQGVNRDDFTALAALSYDPQRTFDWDCNHEVVEERWQKCQVKKTDPGVLAYCGLPMCSKSKSCDFEIDVSKKSEIYLLFSTNDAWMADIEGSLSNVEYALTK
ncbi:MAG: hypothetical protein V1661_02035 [bacterium]